MSNHSVFTREQVIYFLNLASNVHQEPEGDYNGATYQLVISGKSPQIDEIAEIIYSSHHVVVTDFEKNQKTIALAFNKEEQRNEFIDMLKEAADCSNVGIHKFDSAPHILKQIYGIIPL